MSEYTAIQGGILKGKKGLITGVANDKSIAWGVAKLCHEHGAELAFSYQAENLKKRVQPLAESVNSNAIFECDMTNPDSMNSLFENLDKHFNGEIDFVLHSAAFANRAALQGKYYDVSREDFLQSMDISVYTFVDLAKRSISLMKNGGSIVSMTYYGAEKVIPNYNLMGVAKAGLECSTMYLATDLGPQNIRVNSISAGPIKTLAASGISDFKSILNATEKHSPLRRNVTKEDVAGTAVYLFSELASGVTGENIHVDCGYSTLGFFGSEKAE